MTIAYPPRLALARLPTPVEPLARIPLGPQLFVKRDDLTDTPLSGNKIRKLEFLLADARERGCDVVLTCGGEQSNHCRATAIAATRVGLRSVLFLRTADPAAPPPTEANLLLDRLAGAEIRWISRDQYRSRAAILDAHARALRTAGARPYVIPEGGSNALGAWGYVRAVEELATQLPPGPLTIVYAAGSGGTGAGLLLGRRLVEREPGGAWLGGARLVGVNVCDDRDYFVREIGRIVEEAIADARLAVPFARDEIEILDGYVGRGYALSRPEELALLRDVARAEGLFLDPVYTGKAFFALASELRKDPGAFGPRVLFLHTGGVFGLFAAKELPALL